jgi:hypothetical protein
MIVDLESKQTIKGLHFNWGNNPARSYQVFGGESLAFESMVQIVAGDVKISAPYDPTTAEEVSVKTGNVTDVVLKEGVEARYVNVTIVGSFAEDGRGGTVAEFVVI